MFHTPALFPVALTLTGGALAQTASIVVDPPDRAYESATEAEFYIGARNVEDDYPSLTVYLDNIDVTALVGWTWANENRVDVNSDGWLEVFAATAELDLTNLTLHHGAVLELKASTGGVGSSTVEDRSGVKVMGHAVATLAPSRLDPDALPIELCVFLRKWGVPDSGGSESFKIWKNGLDITGSATFVQTVLDSRPLGAGLEDWLAEVRIVTSSLGTIDATTILVVEFKATVPGAGSFTDFSGYLNDGGAAEISEAEEKICDFVTNLGITQTGAGTPLSIGVTNKDLVRGELENLKSALRACQAVGEDLERYDFEGVVDCGEGNLVDVCLGLGGDGSAASPSPRPTSVGGQNAQDKLVIAIGGCGAAGADGYGGSAEARGGDGSIVIAIGGEGSGNGWGGRADAVMDGDGQGHAYGGRGGGDAGQGGNGFTDCAPGGTGEGGQGTASGGPGGHNGDGTEGGDGGGAGVRTTTGGVHEQPGGPVGGGAGGDDVHGSGACATADPAGNGNADRGTPVDNN